MRELSLFQLLRVVKTVINRSFKGIWNAARPRPVWHLFVLLDLCVKIKEEPQLGLLQKESGNQFRWSSWGHGETLFLVCLHKNGRHKLVSTLLLLGGGRKMEGNKGQNKKKKEKENNPRSFWGLFFLRTLTLFYLIIYYGSSTFFLKLPGSETAKIGLQLLMTFFFHQETLRQWHRISCISHPGHQWRPH